MTQILARAALIAALTAAGPSGAEAQAVDLTEPGIRAGVAEQSPAGDTAAREAAAERAASARVRAMEHLGLRLGMTVEEAGAVLPVAPEEVRGTQPPEALRYLAAETETPDGVTVHLRFDRDGRLYLVESTQRLDPGIGQFALKQRVEATYGPADVAARLGLGQYRVAYEDPAARLDVHADIALAGRDAPTVVQVLLIDEERQAANEAAFRAETAGADTPPAAPIDMRLRL